MSYEKQEWNKNTWNKGQSNLENMLNHMEDGIANGGGSSDTFKVLFDTHDGSSYTCDKTFTEICQAFQDGKTIVSHLTADGLGTIIGQLVTITNNYLAFQTFAESAIALIVVRSNDEIELHFCVLDFDES